MKCKACGKNLGTFTGKPDKDGRRCCWSCWKLANSTEPIPYEIPRPRVISVDLDGTLAEGTSWTCDECENAKPNQEAIDRVNQLAEHDFILIHTARRHGLYGSTIKWLRKNGVKFHAISMEKTPSDLIFDLDAVNRVEDL